MEGASSSSVRITSKLHADMPGELAAVGSTNFCHEINSRFWPGLRWAVTRGMQVGGHDKQNGLYYQ
jgi:hypothetical protein